MIRVYQGIDVVAVERIRELGRRHERFLDDVHPLDHTTGRTSKRLYDQVRDR